MHSDPLDADLIAGLPEPLRKRMAELALFAANLKMPREVRRQANDEHEALLQIARDRALLAAGVERLRDEIANVAYEFNVSGPLLERVRIFKREISERIGELTRDNVALRARERAIAERVRDACMSRLEADGWITGPTHLRDIDLDAILADGELP